MRAPSSASWRRRRQPTVDVGARPALGGHDPGDDVLVVADDEAALDACLGGPVRTIVGVGAAADEQVDRLDQHRLAGAGLAGERGQAGTEDELQVDAHRLDVQLVSTVRSLGQRCNAAAIAQSIGSSVGPQRSAQPELGLQDLVEAAFAEAHEAGRTSARPDGDDVAGIEVGGHLAVDRQRRRAGAEHLDLDGLVRIEHERCGRTACAATPG